MDRVDEDALEIHLLADSTGETAARIARAAVVQFPSRTFTLVRHRRVNTPQELTRALEDIRDRPANTVAVFFTLANAEQVAIVKHACEEMDVPYADLMSDAMAALARIAGVHPDGVPLRPVGVETDYFTRIASIDFAVRTDDGAAPGSLAEADICLVGPSRSGKTPLSIFLGYLGYKAVNVPIVPGIAPPDELWQVDKWRLIGLTMDAERLQCIRRERVRNLGVPTAMKDGYADLLSIQAELEEVTTLCRKLGCQMLDTTGIALEESAARVIDMVEERARRIGKTLRRPAATGGVLNP